MRRNSSLKVSLFALVCASAFAVGCGPAAQGDEVQTGSDESALSTKGYYPPKNELCERDTGVEKFAVCHIPDGHDTGHVICIPEPALPAHLWDPDSIGHDRDCLCSNEEGGTGNCEDPRNCFCPKKDGYCNPYDKYDPDCKKDGYCNPYDKYDPDCYGNTPE